MLPPKKNQAAREKHIDTDEEEEKEKVCILSPIYIDPSYSNYYEY